MPKMDEDALRQATATLFQHNDSHTLFNVIMSALVTVVRSTMKPDDWPDFIDQWAATMRHYLLGDTGKGRN